MTETLVAIGTIRAPKVQAVKRALDTLRGRFPRFLPGALRLEPRSVESGVPSTPATTRDMMRGAMTRAENARYQLIEEGRAPMMSLGMEGGVVVEEGLAFLESWSYASDGEQGFFGSSGCIALPSDLARTVLRGVEDLGPATDRYFEKQDVASKEGTFGILTGEMITREEAFVRSMLHALAPFYNRMAYGDAPTPFEAREGL